MKSHQQRVLVFKRSIILATLALVTIIHIGLYYFSITQLPISIASWGISNIGAILLIELAFRQVDVVQTSLRQELDSQQKKSQQQTSLASLSAGLATALSKDEICQEVARRLNEIQGYEFIAIYLVDKKTGNRILRSNVGDLGLPDSETLPPGKGLSEQPLLDGKYQYTPDVSLENAYIPGLGKGSEVDVPIKFGKEVFGVIVVENHAIGAFNEQDFAMLTAASDQTALAIHNTQLYASEKKRRREAEVLRDTTSIVSSDLDLELVLDRILTQLAQVVPFNSASIFLLAGDFLHAKAARGLPHPEEVIGKQFSAEDTLFQSLLKGREPLIINDVKKYEHFNGWGGTKNIGSWLGIPLKVGNSIIGILTLDHNKIEFYDYETLDVALIFGNQAAVAIQNAQLYQSAKNSAEQLMVLHQASQRITSASFDPERTYATIHEAAQQLMPCEAFSIAILDESKDEIEAVYLYDREGRSPSVRISSDQGLSGHIIATGKPVLVHDYLESGVTDLIKVKHFGHPDHIRAFIAVPMRLGNKVMGMLSAQSYLTHKYSSQDQQMLEMLAAHAAIAIDNSQLFAQVQHLAVTDSLTGIFNRRYFFDSAQREFLRSLRYENQLSIMMLDLDNYKKINDLHGHLIGDVALKEFSKIIQGNIRETDILGRYGGDEFSILLPETDKIHAIEMAKRMKRLIQEAEIVINQTQFKTTISVGVSSINEHTTEFSQLLLSADMALYDAKNEGRNKVFFREWPIKNQEGSQE